MSLLFRGQPFIEGPQRPGARPRNGAASLLFREQPFIQGMINLT